MSVESPDLSDYDSQEVSLKPDGLIEIFTTSYGIRSFGIALLLIAISEILAPIGLIEVGLILIADLGPKQLLQYVPLVILGTQASKILHESAHWACYRHFGHDAKVEWNWFGGMAYVTDEILRRNHSIATTLAPLFVISPLALVFAAISPMWAFTLFFSTIFFWNTAGSMNDITDVSYTIRHPPETRYWMTRTPEGFTNVWYFPKDASSVAHG